MRRILQLTVLMGFLLAGCCPITSLHPLGGQSAATVPGLPGIWRLDSAEDRVFLHIGPTKQGGWEVLLAEHKADGTLEHDTLTVSLASIATAFYMNLDLQTVNPARREGQDGNVILKLTFPDRYTLQLSRMKLEAVAAAIRSGGLAGELIFDDTAVTDKTEGSETGERKIQCARITARTDHLRQFLSTDAPGDLFEPYLTFKRITCLP
jgi:hypothetical protein